MAISRSSIKKYEKVEPVFYKMMLESAAKSDQDLAEDGRRFRRFILRSSVVIFLMLVIPTLYYCYTGYVQNFSEFVKKCENLTVFWGCLIVFIAFIPLSRLSKPKRVKLIIDNDKMGIFTITGDRMGNLIMIMGDGSTLPITAVEALGIMAVSEVREARS
ncbi:hypothetical protein IJT10_04405 [bacterium]|nr:hypothetical protein [bacterium]